VSKPQRLNFLAKIFSSRVTKIYLAQLIFRPAGPTAMILRSHHDVVHVLRVFLL
jgi:hypothetical protein